MALNLHPRLKYCSSGSSNNNNNDNNNNRTNEPAHGKTNQVACASDEDSHQPGFLLSLIRGFDCAQWLAKDPSFLHAVSEYSDLSLCWAHMPFCWF